MKEFEAVHLLFAADADALPGVEASIRSVLHHASEKPVIHFIGSDPLPSLPDVNFISIESVDAKYNLTRFTNPHLEEGHGNLNSLLNYVRLVMADIFPDVSKVWQPCLVNSCNHSPTLFG